MGTHHDAGLQSGSRHRARRIGVMGGTFDPIHHGHLVTTSEVQAVSGLDEVIFVPTSMQPFKLGRAVALAECCYLMVVIATVSSPKFFVPRADIERGTITYTVDTLWDSYGTYQSSELPSITGVGATVDIIKWKDADKLFELAHFVRVIRPGVVLNSDSLPTQRVSLVEIPAMAISSTDCRSRVRSYQPVWYLVLDRVVQYIARYGLHQDSGFLVNSAKTAENCENASILKFGEETSK